MHAMNINSCHSPTKFLQPANLTTYTILSLLSVQVELAPLPYCHPSWAICIFLIQITNRFFYICITLPVESAPFFIPSTSFCSLFLVRFTSSCASHHLWNQVNSLLHSVNLIVFTLLLVHLIPGISSQSSSSFLPSVTPSTFHSRLKTHLSQFLSSIVFLS